MPKNYYLILGIGHSADGEEIKRAYRAGAKACHPDTAEGPDPERFRDLQEAYEILSDRDRRRRYDARLEAGTPLQAGTETDPSGRQTPRARHATRRYRKAAAAGSFFQPFEEIAFEVVLHPDEARRGAEAPIRLPLAALCSRCCGAGNDSGLFCPVCRGQGWIRREHRILLRIPPGVPHGMSTRLSLASLGLPGIHLRVTLLVQPT